MFFYFANYFIINTNVQFVHLGLNKLKSGNVIQDIDRQFGTIPPALLFAAVAGSVAAAGVAAQTGIAQDFVDELNNLFSK